MKIIVINKTRWNTTDLRALYKAALRQAGAKPRARASLVVTHRRKIGSFVSGRCFYGEHSRPGTCMIHLPRLGQEGPDFRDEVARVMHHEALHGVGAKHSDMTEEQYWASRSAFPALLELLPHLVVKKKQAEIAISFQKRRKKGGQKKADAVLDQKDKEELSRLKRCWEEES